MQPFSGITSLMQRLIINLCAGTILLMVLIAMVRARRARKHHNISAAEIHPDLGAGEELVRDALDEQKREKSTSDH
jgi:hypothetical protein